MPLDDKSINSGPPELNREEAARKRKRLLDHQSTEAQKNAADKPSTENDDNTLANFILPGD